MIIHADYLWGLKKENQDAYMKGASGFTNTPSNNMTKFSGKNFYVNV